MRKRFLLLLSLLAFVACQSESEPLPPFYNVEAPEQFKDVGPLNTAFTQDNFIYKPGKIFTFEYTYTSEEGQEILIGVDAESEAFGQGTIPWKLVPVADATISDYPVASVGISVFATQTPMVGFLPEQTIIRYGFYNEVGEIGFGELTGLIEDSTKVWLHPPRALGFVILEFSPFPEILKPFDKDTSWVREMHIPQQWSEKLNLDVDGSTSMQITYKQGAQQTMTTPLGELDCYKVTAESTGKLGQTQATFYFHEEFGFVQMEYDNIDGSRLQFVLTSMNS